MRIHCIQFHSKINLLAKLLAFGYEARNGKTQGSLSIVSRSRLVEQGQVRATGTALSGAAALDFDFDDMLNVIRALTPSDFYKSMTTHSDHSHLAGRVPAIDDCWGCLFEIDSDRRCADRFIQGAMTMKCPNCGKAELVADVRDMPFVYKGEATVFAGVAGDYCPACGEGVFDAATSRAISAEMKAFGKQVNAAIVDPSFISTVRKKLDLDQREAAEIFGGGANAFSRYETGKTKPPLALVKLLKVLDRHPDLLAEVRMG